MHLTKVAQDKDQAAQADALPTPEMIAAGAQLICEFNPNYDLPEEVARSVYLAMRRVLLAKTPRLDT